MSAEHSHCPDCGDSVQRVDRRHFMKAAGTAAVVAGTSPLWAQAKQASAASATPETIVKQLYGSLNENQRKVVCFAWDHMDSERGLLRTRVANNWNITNEFINTDFFNDDQRDMVRTIYEGIIQPDWQPRVDKQLEDDAGGFGESQSIAIFGKPDDGKFEFVMTGRHMTLRCDGNSTDHVAFGGPIFYGHAADSFDEKPDHPGNVYWPQAVMANQLYPMLDGRQQKLALVANQPREQDSGFRGKDGDFEGIPLTELSSDQKEHVQKVLQKLIEPYRQSDRDEVVQCLKAQGGLDACHLAFYQSNDIGNDGVWDNWRLEGPSFVWYFRGAPHVHVWVNVADDPSVKLNA
ncbi:MAG: DUF3500 domain-containing protein [Pirellulales bacterium]